MLLMEDRALLDAYRRGDRAGLERVYHHYVGEVTRLLQGGFSFVSVGQTMRFVGYPSAFALQEAVQETFIRAFSERARLGYSGLQPFGPYVIGIARNLVIDDFRRRRRELALFIAERPQGERAPTLDSVDPSALEASPIGAWSRGRHDPEREVGRRRVGAALESFVATLEPDLAELVELLHVERLSQQQIADRLGIDRNHVRKRLALLRTRLLRHMKSEGAIQTLDPDELMALLQVWVALLSPGLMALLHGVLGQGSAT